MLLTVTANPAIDKVYFVDKFEMGEAYRPIKTTFTAGGKGLNVARVAALLGTDTAAMGFAGGNAGQYIRDEIKKLGIADRFTVTDKETRTCINIVDSAGKSGEILESGPEISEADVKRFLKDYEENIKDYDLITVSGSLPAGLDSGFYTKLISIAKQNGKRIIVDTSGKTLLDVVEAAPYMIKPNKSEMSQYLNHEISSIDDVKRALMDLHENGIEIPVCTLGKDGAAAYIDDHFYRYITPDIKIKNTVGSGDSAVAGIASGLCRGLAVKDSIRLGMAAGAANTQFEQTGVVTDELVKKYYSQIIVEC